MLFIYLLQSLDFIFSVKNFLNFDFNHIFEDVILAIYCQLIDLGLFDAELLFLLKFSLVKILRANFEFEEICFSDSCFFSQLTIDGCEVIYDTFLLLRLIKEASLKLLLFLEPLGLLVSQLSFFADLCSKFFLELI